MYWIRPCEWSSSLQSAKTFLGVVPALQAKRIIHQKEGFDLEELATTPVAVRLLTAEEDTMIWHQGVSSLEDYLDAI